MMLETYSIAAGISITQGTPRARCQADLHVFCAQRKIEK